MELKELINQLTQFTHKYGLEINRVFDDFLQYVIFNFTLPQYVKPEPKWPYTMEQNAELTAMLHTLIGVMNTALKHRGWYDPFGAIYEELIAGKYRRASRGQFFTPESLCDLMAEIAHPKDTEITGQRISDPTCGSGRTLLAFNAIHLGNYYVAEDLDRTCAMMTVCNFILHGIKGEVICHNSLYPDGTFYAAWRTNEFLGIQSQGAIGRLPHCRAIGENETWAHWAMAITEVRTPETDKRIIEKLKASAEKHRASIRTITAGKTTSAADKAKIRALAKQIANIKKLIKRYETNKRMAESE
jgi:type I restriction enzyme M protein